MRMKVDPSDYVTGEVLLIKCENERWRPVAFLSKSLNKIEKNYEIHDVGSVQRIRKLEAFIRGCKIKFEV